MRVTVHAPAKINLTLDVVGTRADGYHLLKSVMQSVDCCDTLTAEWAADVSLTVIGGDVCPTEKNTAYRAAQVFFRETGVDGGVHMTLTKRIPQQAGMGGGSADAAAALMALDKLYDTRLAQDELLAMGVQVGADVPFCLVGGTALCEGIGEIITPLPALPDCAVVIAQPSEGVSTAEAYARLDSTPLTDRPDHAAMVAALTAGNLPAVGAQLANVFEPAIALPSVEAIRRTMATFSPLGSRMTGSGSVVYALFADTVAAEKCAATLRETCPVSLVCHPAGGNSIEIV